MVCDIRMVVVLFLGFCGFGFFLVGFSFVLLIVLGLYVVMLVVSNFEKEFIFFICFSGSFRVILGYVYIIELIFRGRET